MLKHSRLMLFPLLVLLVFAFSTSGVLAQGPQPSEKPAAPSGATATIPGLAPWFGAQIDRPTVGDGDDRGRYPSVVTTGGGATYVSYYDATNKDLRLAHYPTSSGNCGPSNSWYCQIIDAGGATGDVGQYSSLAVDPSTANLHLGIAYYDATNYALKYASYSCFLGVCGANIYTVSTSTIAIMGRYASIKFDSTGGVHIAYQVFSASSGVGYAHSVGSGGNCGVGAALGKWQCAIIETGGGGMGQYTSLDLNGSNKPRIAYYDGSNHRLRYAYLTDTGIGNCNTTTTWWCETIDDVGDVGRFASLHVAKGASDEPRIAYYDATNGKLKYAAAGPDGNCGPLFVTVHLWRCDAIADMGTGLTQAGISLDVGSGGYPFIAYQDASVALSPARLRIARPIGAVGELIGNCGPAPVLFYTWQCDTLDGGNSNTDEADYVSLTINSAGLATVAYYESDTYYSTGYLKVIYQRLPVYLPLVFR